MKFDARAGAAHAGTILATRPRRAAGPPDGRTHVTINSLARLASLASLFFLLGCSSLAAEGSEGVRSPDEIMVPADSAGVVYILGREIMPPYRLALVDGRVQVNGVDAEPDAGLVPTERFSDDPAVLAVLDEIRATTARAQAAADSALSSGVAVAIVAARAAETFRASPNMGNVFVLESGDLEVSWRGIPGRQFVALGPECRVPRVAAPDPEASALARLGDAAHLMRRGNFYAAGIGYRVSLSGDLADSLIAAIAAFGAGGGDTLRVGPRRFTELGEEIRRARAEREE